MTVWYWVGAVVFAGLLAYAGGLAYATRLPYWRHQLAFVFALVAASVVGGLLLIGLVLKAVTP